MTRQMKVLSKALLVLTGFHVCAIVNADESGARGSIQERTAKAHIAAMNAAEDFAACFVYFKIAAIGMANSGQPEMEQSFEKFAETALAYATVFGEMGGLMPEAIGASANLQIKEQMAMIGGNTSNIAILNDQYMEPCSTAMQEPESRLNYWLERDGAITP